MQSKEEELEDSQLEVEETRHEKESMVSEIKV